MEKKIIYIISLLFAAFVSTLTPSGAQSGRNRKSAVIELSGRITDQAGNPIRNAAVTSGEGSVTVYTDANGNYSLRASMTSAVLVEAEGYETSITYLRDEAMPHELQLVKTDYFASERDQVSRLDGGLTAQRDLVGAASSINVEWMKRYPDLSLTNSMQGLAPGLIVRAGNGGFGANTANLFVRGHHGLGNHEALVVVDGVMREMDDLLAEEIESIEVLKDATAKVLFGPRAANGVILVTTKRGQEGKKIIRASAEYGVQINSYMPEFLGAYDYVNLYNEARVNDGLQPVYSPAQIEGYRNSKGKNDAYYPNVDWYNEFLRNYSTFAKATLEFNGGNRNVKYSLVAGYMNGQGIEKVGQRAGIDKLNLHGALDIRLNDVINVVASVGGRLWIKNHGLRSQANVMSALSTNKPNEYPLIVDADILGLVPDETMPYFGASERVPDNLYADMVYGGKIQQRDLTNFTNLGLDFNLGKFAKGLSADVFVTFDNFNSVRQKMQKLYPTYGITPYLDENGDQQYKIAQLRRLNLDTSYSTDDQWTQRNLGWRASLKYARTFYLNSISAVAGARYNTLEVKGNDQDDKTINYTLRLNYNYGKRYFAEVAMAYMGSNKYTGSYNEYFFAPTAGLAWLISNESFMQGVKGIDFLKLKISGGLLGSDRSAEYDVYRTRWRQADTNFPTGNSNGNPHYPINMVNVGNPELKWEKQTELNAGIEGLFLSGRLRSEVNYFYEIRDNIIGIRTNTNHSAALGDFTWYENYGKTNNRGVEAHVSWKDITKYGFYYNVGVNFTYVRDKVLRDDQSENLEKWRTTVGKRSSAIITYRYAGLFGRDVDIDSHARQTFGPYMAGDIAYVDINEDGIIDERDQTVIGHTFPSTVWGLTAEFKYKGFGLYILGTAETDVRKHLTGSYYINNGEDGYSVLALDRYHPVNNPTGRYPRLTTSTEGDNSYRASQYWYGNASFFRLKNVELSYTFEDRKATGFYKTLKIFVRGTNLFVLSPLKDLDPERLLAGVTNYPTYRAVTGGLSITF